MLFCFVCPEESTFETRKNGFYFPSTALVSRNKKYILLDNLGSKDNLVIKFDQFMCKKKFFSKKIYNKYGLETCVYKEKLNL